MDNFLRKSVQVTMKKVERTTIISVKIHHIKFGYGKIKVVAEEYEVHGWHVFFSKTTQYSFFTAHGPPYYQERMAISVYFLHVMKFMENRITQWINSA